MLRLAKFSSAVTDLDCDIYINPNIVLAVNTFENPDICELRLANIVHGYEYNKLRVNMSAKEVLAKLQITSDPDIDN